MKKILAVALTVFMVFMSYVVVGGFIQKQQKESNISSVAPTAGTAATTSASTSANSTFTVSEVARHNTTSDCWLIINNNVYSVGSFLGEHPGGASTIIPYCGKDATVAFNTKDRGQGNGHSSQASAMLADYLVGSIK